MEVIYYKAPNGQQTVVDVRNVYEEDETFFSEHSVKISMEELAGDFIVYADTGYENEDGDPEEFIEIACGRSCEEVMKALRVSCEEFLQERA